MKLTLLSLTVGFLCTSVAYSQTYRPDFDCNKVNTGDSIAVMLCNNSQAAKHELEFDQVYYALRQNVGKNNWKALKQAAISDDDIFKECITSNNDSNGTPIADSECYIKDIDNITSKYKSHLSGVDLEESSRSIDEHIRLQQILINSGFLPGTLADGVYGEGTRTAIETWQRVNHRPVSGFISNDDAALLLNEHQMSKTTNSVFDIKQNTISSVPVQTSTIDENPVEVIDTESNFINTINQYTQMFNNGTNDFVKGSTRVNRAKALCKMNIFSVKNWKGTISNLSSNSSGLGVVAIQIASGITLTTNNNSFSDSISTVQTLIHPNDPLYSVISSLSQGQEVKFSGMFLHDDDDCFNEQSLTQEGSMTEPEFTFKFTNITSE